MTWFIQTYRNSVIFRKHSVQSGHITNLAAKLFEDMRYYNVILVCVARIVVKVSVLLIGRGEV